MSKVLKIFCILILILVSAQSIFAQEMKKADLAGSWYPSDKQQLAGALQGYLDQAMPQEAPGRIVGLISPHAGYVFSGRTAGFGFKAVKGKPYKTVVILGFSHRRSFDGISVYNTGGFQTPLGCVLVDSDFADKLIDPALRISFYPDLFNDENSVEMIVPFVQTALPEARIVPIAFGSQDYTLCEILAKRLADLVKDRDDVLIVASTDMSHYHPYDEANRIDAFTIKKISAFKPKELFDELNMGTAELCGGAPVTTMLIAMKLLGADNIVVLKHENSGDVTGDKGRVVGYFSAAFYRSAISHKVTRSQGHQATKKKN